MPRIPHLSLALILLAAQLAPPAAFSQTAAEPPGEASETTPENEWPAPVEEWDTPTRDPEGNPQEAERRGLTSEDVEESLPPDPTQQGTRPPAPTGEENEEEIDLYEALARVRAAPPGLDGRPIPRPNELASEPRTEMEPVQPDDMYLFPDNYIE